MKICDNMNKKKRWGLPPPIQMGTLLTTVSTIISVSVHVSVHVFDEVSE